MSKKYFKYLFKSLWPTVVAYASVFLGLLVLLPFVVNGFSVSSLKIFIGYSSFLVFSSSICIFMAGILPLIIHSRYYSKNSSDIVLSMPMTRKQAFLTEGIFGLMVIGGLVVSGFALGSGLTYMISLDGTIAEFEDNFVVALQALPTFLLAAIITYLSSVFAVSVSNSSFQAVFMIILINSLPYLLWTLIISPMPNPYNAPLAVRQLYQGFTGTNWIYHNEIYFTQLGDTVNFYIWGMSSHPPLFLWKAAIALGCHLVFWVLLDLLALFEFKKLKSEHLGTVIPQRFGAVNALTLTFFLGFAGMGELLVSSLSSIIGSYLGFLIFVAIFLIGLFYWIFIFVVRRKAKVRTDDIIRFAIALFGGFCFGLILYYSMSRLSGALFPQPENAPYYGSGYYYY